MAYRVAVMLDDLLGRLKGVRPSSEGWMARCPAHDDQHPSLSIGHGDDGRWLLHCHAGCTVDAVGGALGRNPVQIIIPCHRVIAQGGRLGGFTGGLPTKRILLRIEGCRFPEPSQ